MNGEVTYLLTPYYQTRTKVIPEGCLRYPETNYVPYNLFALRTRLEPLASKRLNTPVLIHFDRRYLNERLKVVVEFWKAGIPISLSTHHKKYLQRALNYIVGNEPNLSLLMSDGSQWIVDDVTLSQGEQTLIPKWWVMEVSKFLSMSPHLRPHHRPKKEFQIAGIYIDLSLFDSHQSFFRRLYNDSISQLNSMYLRGFISLPLGFNSETLTKWQVKSSKLTSYFDSLKKTLFYPDWEDSRLTSPVGGPVPFLVKHLVQGSNRVILEVGNGLLVRHQVAITFQRSIPSNDYIFRGKFVEVTANNLPDAQKAASLISLSKTVPVGKLITFQFPTPGRLNIYLTVLNNITKQEEIKSGLRGIHPQGYRISDINSPHILSCQIPYHVNSYYYQGLIRNWVRDKTTNSDQLSTMLPISKPTLPTRVTEVIIPKQIEKLPPSIISNLIEPSLQLTSDTDKPEMVTPPSRSRIIISSPRSDLTPKMITPPSRSRIVISSPRSDLTSKTETVTPPSRPEFVAAPSEPISIAI